MIKAHCLLRKQGFAVLLLLLVSCASARVSDHAADALFRDGKYDEAVTRLKAGYEKNGGDAGKDSLLYLLDIALSYHQAGKFDESIPYFARADKVSEIKDYTSISTEAATLVVSDNLKQYKGEEFENVLISVYLAMNYAFLGKSEDALVEARRVNQKLYRMVYEGGRKYGQNAFAHYLSGIMHEDDGDWDGARIDYEKAGEIVPDYPGLGRDLWRMAFFNHDREQMDDLATKYTLTKEDQDAQKQLAKKNGNGELIVIFQNGISPIKRPNPQWKVLPKFYPRYNPVLFAKVNINGEVKTTTGRLMDIESIAMQNLDEKFSGILAKKIAGVVVKEVIANQVERQTGSPLLGFLARAAMYSADQADLRSWNLLPKELQLARVILKPGTYTVKLATEGNGDLPEKTVAVSAGHKTFVNFRYIPNSF